ncbi:MAG: ERF family protein [Prochlorotrichaceae cyanobacterium]
MKNILGAIAKAKVSFPPIVKDAKNPHFKQMYATLGAILSAVEMPLIENGVVIIHEQITTDGEWLLQTSLVHWESEEAIKTVFPVAGADPQKLGSALTYARRYNVLNLLNLSTEDDDGNAASAAKPKPWADALAAEIRNCGMTREQLVAFAKANNLPSSSADFTAEYAAKMIESLMAYRMGEGVASSAVA